MVCPVCGEALSQEMLPIYGLEKADRKGKQQSRPDLGALLPQICTWAIEKPLFNLIGVYRPTQYCCLNQECPLCYKGLPIYLNRPLGGSGPGPATIRFDFSGLMLAGYKAAYKRRPKKLNKNTSRFRPTFLNKK